MAAAGAGDEIRVADGVYTPDSGTGDRTASFVLKDGVSLLGGYAACGAADPDARDTSLYPSVLSGDLNGDDGPEFTNYSDNSYHVSYHVVTYNDPNATGVVLDGFTVTAGNADGTGPNNQGGGIHIRKGADKCLPGGPTIRNCIVEKNWAAHHGAVNDHGLSTVIENCIIRNNFAGTEGSGLQIHSGAPTVINTVFENNESGGEGGGAWAGTDTDLTCTGPSKPIFRDCVFDGNVATKGGAFFIDGSGPSFESCIFQNNRVFRNPTDAFSGFGGGLYNLAGVGVTLQDCFFTQNETDLYGGAMYNEASSPVISGCHFFSPPQQNSWASFGSGRSAS